MECVAQSYVCSVTTYKYNIVLNIIANNVNQVNTNLNALNWMIKFDTKIQLNCYLFLCIQYVVRRFVVTIC